MGSIEVVNIVMSVSVTNIDTPLATLFSTPSQDKMGSRSFKSSLFFRWRDSVLEAVINMWRNSMLIRVKKPGNISSDEEIVDITDAIRRELVKILSLMNPEAGIHINVHNIVVQHRLESCVDLERVYRYLDTAKPPMIEFKYKGRLLRKERKIYPPSILIYIYRPDGSKITAELFPTGSIQIKGTSLITNIEYAIKEIKKIIELSNSYTECIE